VCVGVGVGVGVCVRVRVVSELRLPHKVTVAKSAPFVVCVNGCCSPRRHHGLLGNVAHQVEEGGNGVAGESLRIK